MFGRNTRAAISGWQRDEGLAVTGYLAADQVRELRVQTGGEGAIVLSGSPNRHPRESGTQICQGCALETVGPRVRGMTG